MGGVVTPPASLRLAGAVDIGGTHTKVGIVAEDGSVVERAQVRTPANGDPEPLVDRVVGALEPMLAQLVRPVPGVGVSVAGFLDAQHTAMYGNANLPMLCEFPLQRELEARLGTPCRLEVDSNAAVLAEHWFGAGVGVHRLLGVTVGTGLGGGVIIGGRLLRYTGECAGDLGHVILDPDGPQCTCGARGCLEALVCARALSDRAGGEPVRDVIADARTGDAVACRAVAETARWLGVGLASLAPLFAPDVIVVGGGVAAAGDLLLDPVRASFSAATSPALRDSTRIVGSAFDGWEGMIGAAGAVLRPPV